LHVIRLPSVGLHSARVPFCYSSLAVGRIELRKESIESSRVLS
jgi:hypothetical protein